MEDKRSCRLAIIQLCWLIKQHRLARSSLPLVWAIISASSEPLFAWYTPREGFRMCAQGKSVQSRTADWMIMRAGEYVEITQTVNLANTCLLHNTGVVQVASNELDTLLYRIELSDISQKTMSAMRIYWCVYFISLSFASMCVSGVKMTKLCYERARTR